MKKLIALTLTLILCVGCFVPTFAEKNTRMVQFTLSLRDNYIFARYGLEVFVDGESVGSISQGGTLSFKAALTKGWHKIQFVGYSDNTALTASAYLGYLDDNDTINITLQTHLISIEITAYTKNGKALEVENPFKYDGRSAGELVKVCK